MRFYNEQNAGDDSQQTIGDIIRVARVNKKISLAELSKTTGISGSYLQRIEANHRKNVTLKLLLKIAESLDIPVEDILRVYGCEDIDGLTAETSIILPLPNMISDRKKMLVELFNCITNPNIGYKESLDISIKVLNEFK